MKSHGKTTLILLALIGFNTLLAQDFTFRYTMEELNDVQNEMDIKQHFLGDDIATKFQLLKESYTYIEKDDISLSEKTIVEKPSIYYSVKNKKVNIEFGLQ